MKRRKLRKRTMRAIYTLILSGVLILIFMLRLVHLQVVQHNVWKSRSNRNHISKRVLEMKRGNIYDRRNLELAISVDTYSIFVYLPEVKVPEEVANSLATVLPLNRDEILAKLRGRQDYVLIFKELEHRLATKLKSLNIPGVKFESHYHRYYPQKSLAANLLGFTGTEQQGLEGIELKFDKTLCGYPGLAIQEDISVSDSEPSKLRVVTPPMGGSNLHLTIDAFVQHTLEMELQSLAEEYTPIDATAIAMDPYTGEILGMACYPSYDLNDYSTSKPENRRNRAVTDMFEPGSCMKIFAVASALENKKADLSSKFYCRGYGEIPGRRIRCHGAHGLVDFYKAISASCNGAMTEISKILDPSMLFRTYKNLGFGDATGLDVVSESTGILKPPSKWSAFSPSSLCMGHEMTVTGVQLVQAYSAIANGGLLLKPRLIKEISSPDGDMKESFEPEVIRRVFPEDTAKILREMLMGVVEGGTGRLAKIKDYTAGGKTSTAQKIDASGNYSTTKLVCSFLGMVPAMDPKVVLLVVLNEPKGDEKLISGGQVAAAPFAKIGDRLMRYMQVPPDRPQHKILRDFAALGNRNFAQASKEARVQEPEKENTCDKEVVPNLHGKSLKDVIKSLEQYGLKAIYDGNGVVVSQQPRPGMPIPARKIMRVTLSADYQD
jgi:cell division protein FtsI/penicillin-binding protein 2